MSGNEARLGALLHMPHKEGGTNNGQKFAKAMMRAKVFGQAGQRASVRNKPAERVGANYFSPLRNPNGFLSEPLLMMSINEY